MSAHKAAALDAMLAMTTWRMTWTVWARATVTAILAFLSPDRRVRVTAKALALVKRFDARASLKHYIAACWQLEVGVAMLCIMVIAHLACYLSQHGVLRLVARIG